MGASARDVCRLCASPQTPEINKYNDIFPYDGDQTLARLIRTYLDIEVDSNDNLPSIVCNCCHEKVVSFDDFAVKCKNVQKSLIALQEKKLPFDETLADYLNSDWNDSDADITVKEENSENVSVKSENFSDQFNDDDLLPIAECLKKKSKKKKIKNGISKNKHGKIKKISVKSESENNTVIKEEIDSYIDDFNGNSSDTDGLKRKKKYTKVVSNSFMNFNCHICSEEFLSFGALKSHCSQIHGVRAMVKCMCDKLLYTRHSINRHIVLHDESQGLKCKECNKTFASANALSIHSYVHLPKDQYSHVCSHCAKRFSTALALNIHEKTHIPKELRYIYPCDICGVKFTTKGNVKTHISAVHEKSRPYVCDVCGHAFNNKGNLQDHRVLHNDEKRFTCTKCEKSFKTKGNLQRHFDSHGDRSYKCPECPAVLSTRRTLRMHMCVHEDICRYICAFCNKGYKRRKSLKSHMNIHTGERPYSCRWCSKTFADNSNCRIHKKRMHPNELAEYEALHGKHQIVRDEVPEDQKIIYNISIKRKRNAGVIMIPDISELINEAST